MKTPLLACLLILASVANAQNINLTTPNTATLSPTVQNPYCFAATATVPAYSTVVTGFSADGTYVLGQVSSHFTCGRSGRGSTVRTYYVCTSLQWDLSGNLVNTNTPTNGAANINCPTVSPLALPSKTPPSSSVVGNEFENAGGYFAETVVSEACGGIACYATYYEPTLLIP